MSRFFLSQVATSLFLVSAVAGYAQAQFPGIPGGGAAPAPTISSPDRDVLLTPDVRAGLPRLGENFTVVGSSTDKYNAFGYIFGSDRWINPEAGTADNPLAGMDTLLAQGKYRRLLGFDLTAKPNRQKVVVYGKIDSKGHVTEVTAAALQQPDGSWHSKLGKAALVKVAHVDLLQGPFYGMPVAVYERELAPSPFAIR